MLRESPRLTSAEYQALREFFSNEFGLFFDPSKMTFLENRIIPLMRSMNCDLITEFISIIQKDPEWRGQLLDTLTTNETWFFRHPSHFEILQEDILPNLVEKREKSGKRQLIIWSAGCSIGAEAYSIAITLRETIKNSEAWKIQIIGSDISRKAIERARLGVYTQSEVKLISNIVLSKFFTQQSPNEFKIKPELQSWVTFKHQNLLDPWEDQIFDLIFCRNTMIYFNDSVKAALTQRLYNALKSDGCFFISATETLHWEGAEKFKRFFVRGEYIYLKENRRKQYVLFHFHTPSELLRALNIFVKENFEFYILEIPAVSEFSPQKALYIPKESEEKAEKLFEEALLKFSFKEEFSKSE